jgi:hypothetical protein
VTLPKVLFSDFKLTAEVVDSEEELLELWAKLLVKISPSQLWTSLSPEASPLLPNIP